jgi:hypothetical protein
MRQFNPSGTYAVTQLDGRAGDWTAGIDAGPAVYFGLWNSTYVALTVCRFGPASSAAH